jgi:hypothetical protein
MNCSAIEGKDGAGEASVIHNFRTGYESTNDELQSTANFEFLMNDSVRKPMAAISIFPSKHIHHLAAPTNLHSYNPFYSLSSPLRLKKETETQ